MSKIHQAMRRAEQEGRTSSPLQTPKTSEVSGHKFAPSEASDSVHLDKGQGAGTVTTSSLTEFAERKTTLNSRVIAVEHDTYHSLGERLRRIKADAVAAGNGLTSFLLTSARAGEGKSLTAVNLAIAVSRMFNQRVLLIDGNLRQPAIHEFLGLSRGQGLSDLLQGSKSAGQVIFKTDLPNLYVVTAGGATESPSVLLNTRRMSDFLALVRQQFDWVFLDASAMIPEPEAELLSSFVDGIVLIAGAQTQPTVILEAVGLLRGKNVLGIVRNGESRSTQAIA